MIQSLEPLGVKPDLNAKYIAYINAALDSYEITTPLRQSHFFAQVLHESGMLKYTEEGASGKAYEGNVKLGNIHPGDGVKYKGHGLIQLTGYDVHKAYSLYAGEDFLTSPRLLTEPRWATDSSGWFWTKYKKDNAGHNLSDMADDNLFLRITYFVNGGFNGVQDRLRLLDRAYKVFGVENGRIHIESILGAALYNISNDSRSNMEKSLLKHFPNQEAIEEARRGLDT